MNDTPVRKNFFALRIPVSGCALTALLLATVSGFSQTALTPKLQARLGATTAKLGQVQDSVIQEPEEQASRQMGFVAGEYAEEFRNLAVFKLADTGLTSATVSKATLELVATHQLGAKTPRIAVAQLLPAGGGSDFVLNNYNMYQEPEGEPLLKEGEWTDAHSIDITKILKTALDQADETHGIVFRVWLVSENSGDLADYDNREIKKTSLGTVDLKIDVQKAP
jgi:hypothetical protein